MFNLNHSSLRVVTRLENSYTYDVEVAKVCDQNDPSSFSYILVGGYSANLLRELSGFLNFSFYLMTEPLTYKFELSENLSVDLFASSYSLADTRRVQHVDPTFVIGWSRIHVFFNRSFENYTQDLLIDPFEQRLWLFLILIVTLLCFMGCLCSYLTEKVSLTDSIFHIIGVFLQKDSKMVLSSTASLLTVLTASFTALLLLSVYSAKVVSLGAVKLYTIKTLADLVASVFDISVDIGYGNGSVAQYFAETSRSHPAMMKVLRKIQNSKFRFDTFEKSMLEVERRPFAYIIDEETGYSTVVKATGRIPCDLGTVSFAGMKYPWTMYMRKKSSYKPAINYGILRFAETGIKHCLWKRWIPAKVSTSHDCTEEYSSIKFTHMRSGFLILGFGILKGCVLLAVELWKDCYLAIHFALSAALGLCLRRS